MELSVGNLISGKKERGYYRRLLRLSRISTASPTPPQNVAPPAAENLT